MYYIPQRSPLPAQLGVEAWVADRAIEQISNSADHRPYFGFISFVGPHPPLAPPIPFNRMYDPDGMPDAICDRIEDDHMDEEIPYMQYAIWADAINTPLTRIVKARYYGEISYIDFCLGRILDAIFQCLDLCVDFSLDRNIFSHIHSFKIVEVIWTNVLERVHKSADEMIAVDPSSRYVQLA